MSMSPERIAQIDRETTERILTMVRETLERLREEWEFLNNQIDYLERTERELRDKQKNV